MPEIDRASALAEDVRREPARHTVPRVPTPGARLAPRPTAGNCRYRYRETGDWHVPAPGFFSLAPGARRVPGARFRAPVPEFTAPGPIQTFRGPSGRRDLKTESLLRAPGNLEDLGVAMRPLISPWIYVTLGYFTSRFGREPGPRRNRGYGLLDLAHF